MYKFKSIAFLFVWLFAACTLRPDQSPTPIVQPATTATAERNVTPTATAIVRMQGEVQLRSCLLLGGSIKGFCGSYSVLENRDSTDRRKIELRIVLLPATRTPVEPDPVFFLAGGPGVAATQHWLSGKSMFPGLNQHRDIVLIDQRGTAGDHRIEYPPAPDLTGLTPAKAAEAMQAWSKGALAGIDADPRYYTTAISMDDIDEIRAALGYDLINLYGGSYGATAAQVYLRRHESHVRSVVLDGGSLIDVPMLEHWALDAQRALNLVFSRCEADPACSSAYPSVRREFEELIEQLRKHPLTIHDPESGKSTMLTAWAAETLVQVSLQDANEAAGLPKGIHDIYTLMRSAENNEVTAPIVVEFSEGPVNMMSWTILCSEYWARRDLDEVARLSMGTLFEEWAMEAARDQNAICSVLPQGIAEKAPGTRVRSDVPVLIMNGEADPQNPPENVANANLELPNSLTLILPGAGHTVGHLGCLPKVVVAFIERGSIEGLETECVQNYQPPSFEVAD